MTTITDTKTAVDQLLQAILGGRGGETGSCYAADAVLDATLPHWRMERRGPEAIAAQYAQWFENESEFTELDRHPFDGGEVVTYVQTWTDNGKPICARHSHTFEFDDLGRIRRDVMFCGGRWPAELIAQIEQARHAH